MICKFCNKSLEIIAAYKAVCDVCNADFRILNLKDDSFAMAYFYSDTAYCIGIDFNNNKTFPIIIM